MAFDFMDLFPDSPAAVAGAQGARDILENQYKQSMNFLDMENAMMRTQQARKQVAEQQRIEPLAKTMEVVKLLRGLPLASGAKAFEGIDINDLNSVENAVRGTIGSGEFMTDVEADLTKSRVQAIESARIKELMEGGRNSRDAADRAADRDKQARQEAYDRLEVLNKRWGRTPTPGTRRATELVSDYDSLMALGVPEVARAFWSKHSKLLDAADRSPPGGAKAAGPKASSGPKTFSYKGRNFQLNGTEVKEIK